MQQASSCSAERPVVPSQRPLGLSASCAVLHHARHISIAFPTPLARLSDVLALDVRAVNVGLVNTEVIQALQMVSVMNILIYLAVVNIAKMESSLVFSGSYETTTVAGKPFMAVAGVEGGSRRHVCHSRERIGDSVRGSGRRTWDGEILWDFRPVNAVAARVTAASADAVSATATMDGVSLVSDDGRTVRGGSVDWGDVDRAGVDRTGVDGGSVGRSGI